MVAAVVLWLAFRALHGDWDELRRQPLPAGIEVVPVIAATITFALGYATLIQTWRMIVARWDRLMAFPTAARIWLVSNLAHFIPGRVWQIAAMGVLAQREGISPVAATGSAVINAVVNIAAGFMVVLATGWHLLAGTYAAGPAVAAVLVVAALAGLVAIPWVLPHAVRAVSRLTGRPAEISSPPRAVIAYAVVGNVAAWVLYGVAFRLLATGLLPAPSSGIAAYVAVYALSYLVGYLALPAPAGVGFREASVVTLMPAAELATAAEALVLAIASRLLLTILDVVPAAAFLGRDALRRSRRPQ